MRHSDLLALGLRCSPKGPNGVGTNGDTKMRQVLTQILQWWAFCLHSLSVDRGTFATLVGDWRP